MKLLTLLTISAHPCWSSITKFEQDPSNSLPSEEYDSERVIGARVEHLIKTCNKYEDFTTIESKSVTLIRHNESLPLPTGDSLHFAGVEPDFQLCSPRHTFQEEWRQYHGNVARVFPKKEQKKHREMSEKDYENYQRKRFERRIKVLAVMHPFRRLAKAYLEAFKNENCDEVVFDEIRLAMGKNAKPLSFSDFVDFITRGAAYFKPDSKPLNDWPRNDEWAPYYKNCPACHFGLYPTYVLKSDDHFEKDFEYLQEVFGLEDVEFPSESIDNVSDSILKMLYSQLRKQQLDDLADYFRPDFHMYLYSPDMFYSIVKN